jgi:hypothetical protein
VAAHHQFVRGRAVGFASAVPLGLSVQGDPRAKRLLHPTKIVAAHHQFVRDRAVGFVSAVALGP